MKALKYLLPFWLSILIYTVLSLFSGAMGLSAYDQLAAERNRQKANLESLQALNRELAGDMDALLYDSDTIAAYARELGYGRPEEKFLRIVGIPGTLNKEFAEGQIVRAGEPAFLSNEIIRFISLGAGLALFFSMLLAELLHRQEKPAAGPKFDPRRAFFGGP
ncbi:MAG: septum formation initiator family protein [Treponema sp.]|jgi:cell division protein FtsB|nr:septum formation initiator family protein [Treponema sp.]